MMMIKFLLCCADECEFLKSSKIYRIFTALDFYFDV